MSFRPLRHYLPWARCLRERHRPRPGKGPSRPSFPYTDNGQGPTIIFGPDVVLSKVCEKLREDLLPVVQAPREERVVRLECRMSDRVREAQDSINNKADPPHPGLHQDIQVADRCL